MEKSKLSNIVLILGFFDGIHIGHRHVISSAVNFAKNNNTSTVLLTFPTSPAEYYNKNFEYIYDREYNYSLLKELGVGSIKETEFSKLVSITAENYLQSIIKEYSPIAIFSGFNYTFGAGKTGNSAMLKTNEKKYNYKYFCINPVKINNGLASSTHIKRLINNGDINNANEFLGTPFTLKSKVIKGAELGRKLGFPTANMHYPENIVKLPYGVYKVQTLGKNAVMNWGIKPTINGKEPLIEIHIPNYSGDLYNKALQVKIINKIRDEKKFESIEFLKEQIKRDIEECLK